MPFDDHDDDAGGDDVIVSLSFSPNFYVLDEPTNHLDMETIEALAKALNKFRVSEGRREDTCVCLLCVFSGV